MIRCFLRILNKLIRIFLSLYYSFIFKKLGKNFYMRKPIKLQGTERILIGSNVSIGWGAWLAAFPHTKFTQECKLIIEDGVSIGNFAHIYATKKICIQKNVLIADKVYISDNLHGYEDICTPIIKQPIVQKGEVEIGEGSWIGEGVCIIGAKIGKNVVIGANAVVTKDIPDYCVAVGLPARIIKRYNLEKQIWENEC
ncbi:acyltransferase [Capnocytophaga leadbetteri]|jgi:putative acetyltransferase|uniref:acyltransferase n=1 Tax=Capnocytophaga leadbetteri TaxID=327575 RepID=UPI0028E5BB7B|nr:acyltransferase [Capnocytophaga leadbetteri]